MSLAEMVVIAVVALLAIGPKELPVVLRTVGKWLASLRDIWAELRGAFDDMLQAPIERDDAEMEADSDARYIRDDQGNYHRVYDISDIRREGATPVTPGDMPPLPLKPPAEPS